jgi:hypothetical protein
MTHLLIVDNELTPDFEVTPQPAGLATEAWRQQQLLRVLWRQAPEASLAGWLRNAPAQAARGWSAYRAHGLALAERALAAALPTVAALVGAEAMAALAKTHWRQQPPSHGDISRWGAALPDDLARDAALADWPYLADVARLDLAVAACEAAADGQAGPPAGLQRLALADAADCRLQLSPGVALLRSRWPVATLWQVHQPQRGDAAGKAGADVDADAHGHVDTDTDPLAPARAALARGDAEAALVWRSGWRARVQALSAGDAAFTDAVLAGRTLGEALQAPADAGHPDWPFEPWLLLALQQGWLAAVLAPGAPPPPPAPPVPLLPSGDPPP